MSKNNNRSKSKIALEAWKMAKKNTRKLARVEVKNALVQWSNGSLSTTATITQLASLGLGTLATNDRIGQKVYFKSLVLRMNVQMDVLETMYNSVRIIVLKMKQQNGAELGLSEILEDSSADNAIVSGFDTASLGKLFTVLYDRVISLSAQAKPLQHFKKIIKLNFATKYNDGVAGTVADIETNGITLVMFSDAALDTPFVYGTAKLQFTDS